MFYVWLIGAVVWYSLQAATNKVFPRNSVMPKTWNDDGDHPGYGVFSGVFWPATIMWLFFIGVLSLIKGRIEPRRMPVIPSD